MSKFLEGVKVFLYLRGKTRSLVKVGRKLEKLRDNGKISPTLAEYAFALGKMYMLKEVEEDAQRLDRLNEYISFKFQRGRACLRGHAVGIYRERYNEPAYAALVDYANRNITK